MNGWVLVIFDPKTNEVQVRGPWNDPDVANGAMRYVANQHTGDENPPLLAIAGVTPMVYFDPLQDRERGPIERR